MRTLPRDEGMTLVELLLSMSILSVIMTAISGAYLAFLSSAAETSGRDDHSAGIAVLSSYLDRDLTSATTVATAGSSCLVAGAEVALQLTWTEYTATTASPSPVADRTWTVTYSVATDPDTTPVAGPQRYKVTRSLCAPSATQEDVTVASALGSDVIVVGETTDCRGTGSTRVDVTVPSYSTDDTEPYHYVGCVRGRLS